MQIVNIEQMQEIIVKTSSSAEEFQTLEYKEKPYRRISSFDITHRDFALKAAKQTYLENKGKINILLVDEVQCWGIWQADETLIRIPPEAQPSLVDKINLKKLVAKMRDIGGISISDRRHKLKIYPRCFIGEQAVAWFVETLDLEYAQAIALGQRLIDEKIVHHVTDEHQFKDEYLFYRFYWDEKK